MPMPPPPKLEVWTVQPPPPAVHLTWPPGLPKPPPVPGLTAPADIKTPPERKRPRDEAGSAALLQ